MGMTLGEKKKRREEEKAGRVFVLVGFFCRDGITAFLFLEDCWIGLVCFGVDGV